MLAIELEKLVISQTRLSHIRSYTGHRSIIQGDSPSHYAYHPTLYCFLCYPGVGERGGKNDEVAIL